MLLEIYNIIGYNLICTGSDIIHQSYPSHHILSFQFFRHALFPFHFFYQILHHITRRNLLCLFFWGFKAFIKYSISNLSSSSRISSSLSDIISETILKSCFNSLYHSVSVLFFFFHNVQFYIQIIFHYRKVFCFHFYCIGFSYHFFVPLSFINNSMLNLKLFVKFFIKIL